MHLINPRAEWTHDGKRDSFEEGFAIPIIIVSVFYVLGFFMGCFALAAAYPSTPLREKPWIPARARGDACLTPLFFVLPAFLFPLAPAALPFLFMYLFLRAMVHGMRSLVGPATSCCGIPLPRWWSEKDRNVAAGIPSAPDLEMGPVVSCAEDGAGGEPGGAVDSSGPVGARSAGSSESERPPSYTSLSPEDDEDDSGEADGLLAKNTEEVEMVRK